MDEAADGLIGKLIEVKETTIIVEETSTKKNKKEMSTPVQTEIAFDDIKSALVCIEF
jgi:hypothetical protein